MYRFKMSIEERIGIQVNYIALVLVKYHADILFHTGDLKAM